MRKLIFLDNENLTKRRKETFYLEEIVSAAIKIEYWDLSICNEGIKICDEINEPYLKIFKSKKEIIEELQKVDIANTIFIFEIFKTWEYIDIIRFLTLNKCTTVKIELYSTIFKSPPESLLTKVLNSKISALPKAAVKYLNNLSFRLYCKINRITLSFNHLLTSDTFDKNATAHINHQDWQRILKVKNQDKSADIPLEPYVVFIDQYYPLHPDFIRDKAGKLGNTALYQNELNRFFSVIESDLKLKVIICAHPKADYSVDTFNGRSIYKYRTEEFIKYSDGVILHNSLAVVYAVVFDKPLLLMTNNEHQKNRKIAQQQSIYSNLLKIPIVNTESIENIGINPFKKFDSEIKEKIIYGYLTSKEHELKENSELIINYFRGL